MYKYEDAILIDDLTKQEVVSEISQHDADPNDFFDEIGDKELYTGKEVLDWLGY